MGLIGAAAIIVNEEGAVLLVKHTYGKRNWEIPGGRAEEGESPVDTAIREVREETGLSVVALHMTGYYYDREAGGLHFVFRCKVEKTKWKPGRMARKYQSVAIGDRKRCRVPSATLPFFASMTLWRELNTRFQRGLGRDNGWNEPMYSLVERENAMPDEDAKSAVPAVFELPIRVVEADIDAMGHVNNIVYMRWVQEVATAHWNAAATEQQKADLCLGSAAA